MENQPVSPIAAAPQPSVAPTAAGPALPSSDSATTGSVLTGEWPTVPPAPTPVIPPTARASSTTEPPVVRAATEADASTAVVGDTEARADGASGPESSADSSPASTSTSSAAPPPAAGSADGSNDAADPEPATGSGAAGSGVRPRTVAYEVDDDPPTMGLPTATPAEAAAFGAAPGFSRRLLTGTLPGAGRLSRPRVPISSGVRTSAPPTRIENLVWQPTFAYASGLIIAAAISIISLPLWIVLFRGIGTGAPIKDLIALCMMLAGGYLTGTAIWIIVTEMRGRFRMVDRMARTGEREANLAALGHELAGLQPPQDPFQTSDPYLAGPPYHHVPEPLPALSESGEVIGWQAPPIPPAITARVEAQQAAATATLEASSKLLASFGAVLKSFGQLYAQVAILVVALALFIGATALSLN